MSSNIGSAILILGCLYFGYNYGFDWWLIILIVLAVATWTYHGFTKRLFKAQIEMLKAKAEYYRKKAKNEV